MKATVWFVGLILMDVFSICLGGVIVSCLWSWFIIPLGMPSIGLVHATGLMMVASFLTMSSPKSKQAMVDNQNMSFAMERWFHNNMMMLISWAMSWVIHMLM